MTGGQRTPGTGGLRQRGSSWELKYETGADPATGERQTRTETIRGTRKDAEKALAARIARIDRGEHVDPSKMTVAELVTSRIEAWRAAGKNSPATHERYVEAAEAWIFPHVGNIPVQRLSTVDVEKWHNVMLTSGRRRREGGLSRRSCRMAHGVLVQALKDAVRHNLVVRNVAAMQGQPKGSDDEDEIQIIRADQIDPMLAQLEGDPFYAPTIVTLYTGVRRGELLALPWKHVDLDNGVMHVLVALEDTKAGGVRLKPTKTKAGRRSISMPDNVVAVLREVRLAQLEARAKAGLGKLPEDAIVFLAEDGGYQNPTSFSLRWHRTVRRLGLPIVTFHALRHTHASMLIDLGENVVKISRRLGHANPNITLGVYAHLFRADDSDIAAAINKMLTKTAK